jgi:hypothetical protein
VVRLLQEGPLFCLLASMPATRTIRPTVVALLASATAPAACPLLALADLNAFPPSARADLNAFPPSAIADFATVLASTPTSDLLVFIVSPLASLVDPATLR